MISPEKKNPGRGGILIMYSMIFISAGLLSFAVTVVN